MSTRKIPLVRHRYHGPPRTGTRLLFKLLLATEKVDVDLKDNSSQTPLLWAARYGHEAIVKLLLATEKVGN